MSGLGDAGAEGARTLDLGRTGLSQDPGYGEGIRPRPAAGERHVALALEAAQMGTWELDLQTHEVRRTASTDRLFGLPPSDEPRLDEAYLRLIHPDDMQRVKASIARTITDGVEHAVEYRVCRPDGSVRWLASRGELLRGEDGAPLRLIGALLDLTDRRGAEAALQASEERFRATFEYAPVGIAHVALDGQWLMVNERLCTIMGYPRDELLGQTFKAITHPDDLAADLAGLVRVLTGELSGYEAEKRYLRKDGQVVWAKLTVRLMRPADGSTPYFISVVEDITARQAAVAERETLLAREQAARTRAEQIATQLARLHEVAAALAQALTPAQVAAVVARQSAATLEASSSVVRLVNAAAGTLEILASVGVPAEVTSRWHSVPLSAPFPIAAVIRSGTAAFFESREAIRPWYEAVGATVETLGYEAFVFAPLMVEGQAIGSLALTFDRARAFDSEDRSFVLALAGQCAQALERARLYAAAQEAVASRDGFIAVASHDLRTPITALLGQAQILERRAITEAFSERSLRSVRAIAEAAARLNRMIEALLDLSRIQLGLLVINPAPLLLGPFVRRVVDELQPTLGAHQLLVEGAALPLTVNADELRLEQVLHNLIGNAVKYSPHGSDVRLILAGDGERVQISVSDHGIGISADALPHLFERFYRAPDPASQSVGGLGVGLYIVRELVALHGGTISVNSAEGEGSTFTVTLPVA